MAIQVKWQLKALLPVLAVLLNGVLLFILATVSLEGPERRTVIVVATVGAIVICAVLLLTLGYIVSRPMLELQEKIERVRNGDLNATVNFATRNDDIGELGRNFNQMVRELRESRETVERHQQEIQWLYRTQMSKAEHLAALGELAAGLAHEIRNPLAGIAGVVEVIGRDLPESSPAREVVAELKQEVMRINNIIADLLETARPRPPEYRMADLNATAEHAVIFARQQSLARPVNVQLHKDEKLPLVEHDANQVQQVLLNLMLNAIQALEGPGEVVVDVAARDGAAVVSVTDTGKGISEEHLPNIWRPFFTTKGHGTGLGLSLARRIVEDHGGRIEVASKVGIGSTFEVILPMKRKF